MNVKVMAQRSANEELNEVNTLNIMNIKLTDHSFG